MKQIPLNNPDLNNFKVWINRSIQTEILSKDLQKLYQNWQQNELARQDFETNLTDEIKAEWIDGKIVIQSPVNKAHNNLQMNLAHSLNSYVNKNKLGYVGGEKLMVRLLNYNLEPDISFFKDKQFPDEQVLFPAPDFVVEILSKSTEKFDREKKFAEYALNNVLEYWIIHPNPNKFFVEQYILEKGKYILKQKISKGKINSIAVKGYAINVEWLLDWLVLENEMQKSILKKSFNLGKQETALQIAQNLLQKNMPIQEISQITGLSIKEIKSIK